MRTARITGPAALGRILRESRLMQELTQEELAERLGVNRRYIIELEGGKPTKALERLFEYMSETGVSIYGEITEPVTPQRRHFFDRARP